MMQYVNTKNEIAVFIAPPHYQWLKTKVIAAEFEKAFQSGCTKVMVDFTNTKTIDSSSIGQLCSIRNKVKPENFSVIHPTGKVLQELQSSNLTSWIKE